MCIDELSTSENEKGVEDGVHRMGTLDARSIESGNGLELLFHSGMKHKYFP